MAELARVTKENIDASAEVELLEYEYTGTAPKEVIARATLGSAARPIAGGGIYTLKFYLGDSLVIPNSDVTAEAGVTRAAVVSRQIPVEEGDVVRVTVIGLAGDTSIDAVVTLRDATPLRAEELAGAGTTPVDHDHGGTDNLAYKTEAGAGIGGATVHVYLTADYDANRRSNAYVVGRATTDPAGRWDRPVMLDPGDYTAILYKRDAYGPDRVDLTVS
jgi:hypothetical protein